MKWRVQLVKQTTVMVSANSSQNYQYNLAGIGEQQYRYTFIAERDAQINVHFNLGSLDESGDGVIDLLIQLYTVAQNSNITITASVVTGKQQSHKIVTEQLHTAPDTQSSVAIKAVVKEGGKHDYQGVIRLEQNSLRANAQQENKILQLGKAAKVSSEPTLQILHDDVQCGHGTAISQIDQEQLLYCQSRGISKVAAQQLLIESFLISQ
jgi:Fe-S cluster assembly scaffold protein SufB